MPLLATINKLPGGYSCNPGDATAVAVILSSDSKSSSLLMSLDVNHRTFPCQYLALFLDGVCPPEIVPISHSLIHAQWLGTSHGRSGRNESQESVSAALPLVEAAFASLSCCTSAETGASPASGRARRPCTAHCNTSSRILATASGATAISSNFSINHWSITPRLLPSRSGLAAVRLSAWLAYRRSWRAAFRIRAEGARRRRGRRQRGGGSSGRGCSWRP